jgi:hypothetical protein
MRIFAALALAALALLAWATPGTARMHAQMYCWTQDSEFPVPCEQDEEEDEGGELSGFRDQVTGDQILARTLKPDPSRLEPET